MPQSAERVDAVAVGLPGRLVADDAQALLLQQSARSLQEEPIVIHDEDAERHMNRVTEPAAPRIAASRNPPGSIRNKLCPWMRSRSCCPEVAAPAALARLKKRDDGARAAVVVVGFWDVQLHQDAAHVFFDGSFGDPKLPGDTGI